MYFRPIRWLRTIKLTNRKTAGTFHLPLTFLFVLTKTTLSDLAYVYHPTILARANSVIPPLPSLSYMSVQLRHLWTETVNPRHETCVVILTVSTRIAARPTLYPPPEAIHYRIISHHGFATITEIHPLP